MTRSRILVATVALALGVGGVSALAPAANAAPTTCRNGAVDFDQNGGTDAAIGVANAPVNATGEDASGVVDVHMKFAHHTETVLIPNPGGASTDGFGASVAEVDLSGDTGRTSLCSVLAVSAQGGLPPSGCERCPGYGPRVILFRWDAATSKFVQLSVILTSNIFPDGGGGDPVLASQTMGSMGSMASTTPSHRQPVLWVGASGGGHRYSGGYNAGEVARVALKPDGSVASKEIFTPGASRTAQLPLSGTESGSLGASLQGTPSADQVIVGAPDTTVSGHPHAGAVVVLNRGGASQLITEDTGGVPGGAENADYFGSAVWLSTQASSAAGKPTSLWVGSPGESLGRARSAGAATQLRYDRSVSPARVTTTAARFWSQATAGVAGTPESDDLFGSSFESLTNRGSGAPKILVGVPGEDLSGHADAGTVDVLGDGRAFTEATGTGARVRSGAQYGALLASWRDTNDRVASDPVHSPGVGQWSRYVIVAAPGDHAVAFGLPAGNVHSSNLTHPPDFCFMVNNHVRCGGPSALTSSGGG